MTRWMAVILLGATVTYASAQAEENANPALEDTKAFERAYAASYYEFDACGDGLGGRIYRNALSDRVRHCPFSDVARKRFQTRAAAQRRKSSEAIAKLIEDKGGLPVRLDGMIRSCREQADSPEYRSIRSRLDDFSAGKVTSDVVVDGPCDAPEITP